MLVSSIGLQTPKKINYRLHKGIKVFVPASLGNVAGVEGVIGIALQEWGIEVIAKFCDEKGVRCRSVKGFLDSSIKADDSNPVVISGRAVYDSFDGHPVGVELHVINRMPELNSVGIHAALSVAGALAVNELLGRPYEKRTLFDFVYQSSCEKFESDFRNHLAASLMGGCMLWKDGSKYDIVRVAVPRGLYLVVLSCESVSSNKNKNLNDWEEIKYRAADISNVGAFVLAMTNADFRLIKSALEASTGQLIEGLHKIVFESEALGAYRSKCGNIYVAMYDNSLLAEEGGRLFLHYFKAQGLKWNLLVSGVNNEGAVLI